MSPQRALLSGRGHRRDARGAKPAMSEDRIGFLYGYVRAGGAVAFAVVARLQSPTAATREFRAADIQEENYPTVQALRYLDRLVTERTGGRHRIRVFHSRQLGEESQTIE